MNICLGSFETIAFILFVRYQKKLRIFRREAKGKRSNINGLGKVIFAGLFYRF
jgi:hypothetical protein